MDAHISTETILSHSRRALAVDLYNYEEDLMCEMALAWRRTYGKLKLHKRSRSKEVQSSSRRKDLCGSQGKAWKLARPFHVPYRILQVLKFISLTNLKETPYLWPWIVYEDAIQNKIIQPGLATRRSTNGKLKYLLN